MNISQIIASLFTAGERRGILVLVILLFITGIIKGILPDKTWTNNGEEYEEQEYYLKFDALVAAFIYENKPRQDTKEKEPDVESETKTESETESETEIKPKEEISALKTAVHRGNAIIIEVNSANEKELASLPGIGTILSGRIIKYRNLLGGFVRKEQLLEVYGISSDCYKNISNLIFADTLQVKKIDINNAPYGDIIRHPYLNKENADDLFRYKKRYGEVKELSSLIYNEIWPDSVYYKIRPYLKAE